MAITRESNKYGFIASESYKKNGIKNGYNSEEYRLISYKSKKKMIFIMAIT